jgi:glyoxylase-like metal-dependent hydrolase (beta-lactamase superfamily II)
MTDIARFVFTPFQENTYVVYDDTQDCVIVDPGCYSQEEQDELTNFIENNELNPVKLLNTHCHVDHIAGNKFIGDKYNLKPYLHKEELPILQSAEDFGQAFGLTVQPSPPPEGYLQERDTITFGNTKLKVLFTPGHSPGSISFFNKEEQFIISGDVLFLKSIGRYDFPGGDLDTLLNSIREKLFPLGDEVVVYSGHGPETTIGFEKQNNPFLNEFSA